MNMFDIKLPRTLNALVLVAACGGTQSRTEVPAQSTPMYSTTPAAGQHTMPDGTTMSGHEHMDHDGHHTMPDGTQMAGHQHMDHAGGQHLTGDGGAPHQHSSDGGVPHGHSHHGGATHVMPDGAVMPGASHGAHQH